MQTTTPATLRQQSAHFTHSTGLLAAILALSISFTNIWVLPQKLSIYGGGAYLIVMALSLLLFGLPFLLAELLLGRLIARAPNGNLGSGALGGLYMWFGRLCVLVALIMASIFSMVSGWGLAYAVRVVGGEIASAPEQPIAEVWQYISSNTEVSLLWHTLFLFLVLMISARPVVKGLQRYAKRLLLALGLCLSLLLFMAIKYGNAQGALQLMRTVDFSSFDFAALVSVWQHVFYSLGLGIGALMVLGSYSVSVKAATAESKAEVLRLPILKISLAVVLLDFAILLALCFCLLALVPVPEGEHISADFDLIFVDLPMALSNYAHGQFMGVLFYAILVLSGVGSTLVLLEPLVAKLEQRFGISRLRAARLAAIAAWILGLGSVLSFSLWRDDKISLSPQIGDKIYTLLNEETLYTILSYLAFGLLLPLLGLILMYFVGFMVREGDLRAELPTVKMFWFESWYMLLRNAVPVIMFLVLLQVSGAWAYFALWFA